ncbi:hypothetical protein K443DRAFT_680748, partial [Laccaria amethystina LaAM-08-1]
MTFTIISETWRRQSPSKFTISGLRQGLVKDDNVDDTSCGIRLLSMRTTLVKSWGRDALLTVQEHPRLPNRLKLTVSRRRLPIPTPKH